MKPDVGRRRWLVVWLGFACLGLGVVWLDLGDLGLVPLWPLPARQYWSAGLCAGLLLVCSALSIWVLPFITEQRKKGGSGSESVLHSTPF
jgi:hypothetical protein